MRWEDERYVRLYTRDTPEWSVLDWEARAVFYELLRKVDRAGFVPLGKSRLRGLAGLLRMPVDVVTKGVEGLIDDGCVELTDSGVIVRNFIEAQEARQTDKARQRACREKARDLARSGSSDVDNTASQNVTDSHTASRDVTLGHSDLIRSDPNQDKKEIGASAPSEPDGSVDPSVGQPNEPQPGEPEALAPRAVPSAPSSSVGQQPLLMLEPPPRAPPRPADDIFAAYLDGWRRNNGRGRAPVLDEKRKRLIAARLKEFDVEHLKAAARGIWASSWHLTEGQTTLDLVMRDAAHVERFAALDPAEIPKRGEGPIYEEDDLSDAPPMRPSVLACSRSSGKTLDELIANWGRTSASVGMGTGTEN